MGSNDKRSRLPPDVVFRLEPISAYLLEAGSRTDILISVLVGRLSSSRVSERLNASALVALAICLSVP